MRNRARERLKRELVFLKERVVELEAELGSLRAQKRPRTAIAEIVGEPQALAWRYTADTERVKRTRSERENEFLRNSLERQLHVATELSHYLRQRAADSHDSPIHVPPTLVASSYNLVISQFLSDIDRAYHAISCDVPALEPHFPPDERVSSTAVKTRKANGYDQMYVEMFDTAYRSQPYERACDAAWVATRLVYANEDRSSDVGPCTNDIIAARYRSMGQTRRGTVKDIVVTSAAKKFMEKDRCVIVWRTCSSPAQHDSEMPMQAVSDETGWMVLTKIPEGVPNRAAGTAYYECCSRLVPIWYEGNIADSSVRAQLTIGEFTNVVLSATEADATGFESAFERLVLHDDAVSSDSSHAVADAAQLQEAFV